MTDAEREALVWLDAMIGDPNAYDWGKGCARTIKAMLAEPALSAEPSETLINSIVRAVWGVRMEGSQNVRIIAADVYQAVRTELTKPKTRTVEVWRVEYSCREFDVLEFTPRTSTYPNTPEGIRARDGWIESFKSDARVACIHITGPHTQEVPA